LILYLVSSRSSRISGGAIHASGSRAHPQQVSKISSVFLVVLDPPVAERLHAHLRNAKLQLTAVLAPAEEVPGLYLHPDHRRRLRRATVRSTLDV